MIVDSDVNASAGIQGSKLQALVVGTNAGVIPSTGVANADVSATAAIVDTKLAQITTAAKVSGAALTLLGSIPAGAGVIPGANVTALTAIKTGTATRATGTTGTFTIAHGLGKTPTYVHIIARHSTSLRESDGTASATDAEQCVASSSIGTAFEVFTDRIVFINNGASDQVMDVSALDTTNITLNHSTSASDGSVFLIWVAAA